MARKRPNSPPPPPLSSSSSSSSSSSMGGMEGARTSSAMAAASIPQLFRCPISLDLFTDPVTLCTGQTYDRPSIERWLAGGNLTCPVTMQRLSDPSLVPNHTLRHLIHHWLLSGDSTASSAPSAASRVAAGDSSLAVLKLKLQSCDAESKLRALEKIRAVSSESDSGKQCLIQLGFLPLLLRLLFENPGSELAEAAIDCVLRLSSSPESTHLEFVGILSEEEGLFFDSFMALFEQGSIRVGGGLCTLMELIAAALPEGRELFSLVGKSRRAVGTIVGLLGVSGDTRDAAAGVLHGICAASATTAIEEGAVAGLIGYLSCRPVRRNAHKALASVELLVSLDSGKTALMREGPDAVRVLVRMLFRGSPGEAGGSEHAAGALIAVCAESAKARAEAVGAGAVVQLLLLLQCQSGSRAKSRGRALLKLLRCVWAEDPWLCCCNYAM